MGMTPKDELESIVRSHAEPEVFSEFRHFHVSVSQKLWSTEYYCGSIADLKPVPYYGQLRKGSAADTQDDNVVADDRTQERFALSANMFLDGLLMNAMATLDTLAHEIGVIYALQTGPPGEKSKRRGDLYISTIGGKLGKCHSASHLAEYLGDELTKEWFGTLV
jgi:hypothetical protein